MNHEIGKTLGSDQNENTVNTLNHVLKKIYQYHIDIHRNVTTELSNQPFLNTSRKILKKKICFQFFLNNSLAVAQMF